LDAEVELVSTAGTRRMPLTEFIRGNRRTQKRADEVLTAVLVPRQLESTASAFLKLGARKYLVISISMVAVVLESNDSGYVAQGRVAVGSCSAVARRLSGLERDLVGQPADPQLGSLVRPQHLATLSPIDDIRATAEYRRDASITLVRRALQACVGST
jgi:CO/xanthine dehydrogenase FAD-binding subunit